MDASHHMATTSLSFFALLGAGLFTGLSHCVGMCGPLVSAFVLRRQATGQELWTPLILFQMGRLTTYTLWGATVGGMGAVLAAALRPWQGVFSMAVGLLIILIGLGLSNVLPLQGWMVSLAPARFASRWMKRWLASSHPAAPLALGLANGLLPCGAVYAMTLLAAMSGDPLQGASLMLIFGFGTLPAMLGFGYTAALLSLRLRTHLFRVAALVVMVVGVQLALRGLALNGHIPHTGLGGVMLW
jgi:sulfite exporter TauE/SafE